MKIAQTIFHVDKNGSLSCEVVGDGRFVYFSGHSFFSCFDTDAVSKYNLSMVDHFLRDDLYLFAINDKFHIYKAGYKIKKFSKWLWLILYRTLMLLNLVDHNPRCEPNWRDIKLLKRFSNE